MAQQEKNSNKSNNSSSFLNKIYKFTTKEKREIIGKLEAYNKEGNFYLVDCVEVFDKNSDHFATNELFLNNNEHTFYYESDNYQYQYINNCVFPLEEIGDIFMLKEEIYNKYKKLLDNYYKEMEEKKLKEEKEKEEEEKAKANNIIQEENKTEEANIDEIYENIKTDDKKKKKKKKKKNK